MAFARAWFLLAVVPLLAGWFGSIYSEQPLGEPVVLDPKEWNGRWVSFRRSAWYTFSVIDSDTLVVAYHVCDPSQAEYLVKWKLRRAERWYIREEQTELSVRGSKISLYTTNTLWFRDKEGPLYQYLVNDERVKALVEQGDLSGRIENHLVILGALTLKQKKLLFAVRELDHPLGYPRTAKDDFPVYPEVGAFIKLSNELDPCKKGDKGK